MFDRIAVSIIAGNLLANDRQRASVYGLRQEMSNGGYEWPDWDYMEIKEAVEEAWSIWNATRKF